MMIAALCALAFGAIAGVFLASRHFLHRRMPAWGALVHGVGGATGFALVLLTVAAEPTFQPARGVLYLLIATIGLGCVNLLFHVRKVRHRTSLILTHGLCAVCAASWLVYAIVAHRPALLEAAEPPSTALHRSLAAPAPPAPATAPASVVRMDPGVERVLGRSVLFETNRSELGRDSRATLSQIADALKAHPEITLTQVQGHTDERGDETLNMDLAGARATAIVDMLVREGVARERLHAAGYGARCPADPACADSANPPPRCHASAGWEKDRRVAFQVLEVGGAPVVGALVCNAAVDLVPEQDRRFLAR